MVSWGYMDFLLKRIVGPVGYFRLLIYVHLVGLAPLFLLAIIYTPPLPSSIGSALLVLGNGVFTFLTVILWFKAISVGKISIVTPIMSGYAIVAIILSFVILGEILSVSQSLCITLVIAGILIISSRSGSYNASNAGIPYALGVMFLAGLDSILLKLISIDIGGIGAFFFNRALVTLFLLFIVPFVQSLSIRGIQEEDHFKSIVILGLLEFIGFFAFIIGVSFGIVSIIVPISAAAPAVTLILARLFLKEKLNLIQRMAVVSIILGIVLLSILSSG
jgi:transporter family protein